MNAVSKTAAETKLDELIDGLKSNGMVIVYSLGRYDDEPGKQSARFSTRISYPDSVDPDHGIERMTLGFAQAGKVSESVFGGAIKQLRDEGWDVFIGVHWNADPSAPEFTLAQMFTGCEDPSEEHRKLDLIREVMVEWSNARHTGKLVWQE